MRDRLQLPDSTLANAKLCGIQVFLLSSAQRDFRTQLVELDASLALVASRRAANFSTGVNLAYRLLSIAAEVMGAELTSRSMKRIANTRSTRPLGPL